MRSKKIKLCGINDLDILKFCIEYPYSPDFLGFVFFKKSPRNISFAMAKECANLIPSNIAKVAVVVDPNLQEIEDIITCLNPDFIQLHGNESLEFIRSIRDKFGKKIIKAITVSDVSDVKRIGNYEEIVDYLLFDTKTLEHGGSGQVFDWKILEGLDVRKDFFLSGGLNIANLEDAISETNSNYFDLSSGIELQKGVKDTTKIAEILDYFKTINEETDSR